MRQILAMGGGGFSMEPENLRLDRFLLSLAAKPSPAVCFVPTAGGDSSDYIERFYRAFQSLPCRPTHLPLFKKPPADIRGFVFEQDVIYVGGGSTRNLLALWREWGLDAILRDAWEAGIVLAGVALSTTGQAAYLRA